MFCSEHGLLRHKQKNAHDVVDLFLFASIILSLKEPARGCDSVWRLGMYPVDLHVAWGWLDHMYVDWCHGRHPRAPGAVPRRLRAPRCRVYCCILYRTSVQKVGM